MDRPRLARFIVLGAGVAVVTAGPALARRWPKEQTVHYVLGDAAPKVEEVDARWSEASDRGESIREVDFRYPHGEAPRIASHEPRLSDGDYTVEIDVVAAGRRSRTVRHVRLGGGVISIDLSAFAASVAGASATGGESP